MTLLVLAESQGADRNRGSAPLGGYQPILSLSLSHCLFAACSGKSLTLSATILFSLLFFPAFLILIIPSYSPIVAAVASSADGICPLLLQTD